MCGFSGYISPSFAPDHGKNILEQMGNSLFARGPDGEGIWVSNDGSLGLVHRRLAVIGLGPGGRQPMLSESGRYVLVFNGEIYNYQELRTDLLKCGASFSSDSDTEVLLIALEMWGVQRTLERCVGMFAFALWDCKKQTLFLARDRFGEKPLYYGWQGRSFLFGSTLDALRQHPHWQGIVDKKALSTFIQYDYVPAPLSIYENINKLLPGSWFQVEKHGDGWRHEFGSYWTPTKLVEKSKKSLYRGSFVEAANTLETMLCHVLKGQMLSEVPIGAFLSGGVDSSTVVALMQRQSSRPIRTFTISFDNLDYDESSDAERVARHLGTDHTTYPLREADVVNLIPRLPSIYDEPFADASQLPTALVSQVARRDVTVALSGDGGDEIFGGYNRYVLGDRLSDLQHWLPLVLRRLAAKGINSISPSGWDRLLRLLLNSKGGGIVGEKIHKFAAVLSAKDEREMYTRMTTFWLEGLPLSEHHVGSLVLDDDVWHSRYSFQEKMMLADTLTYLPDDILCKVDRAAMAFSLETRAPLLDHRLFEFVWSLPSSYRIRENQGKAVLREVLYRYVPRNLIERPKKGFSLPIGDYLRGPLRDWAESLLSTEQLSKNGYFDSNKVRSVWEQHLSGRVNRQYDLWSVLMFQAWDNF